MNEDKFASLCRIIEKAINAAFEYQWHPDNLSEYHSALFSEYGEDEYMTVYIDGYHIPEEIIECLQAGTGNIGEIEIDLENLRDEISGCTEEQLERLKTDYCLHFSDSGVLAYLAVNGMYAVVRKEYFDPDVFNCGALPYDISED